MPFPKCRAGKRSVESEGWPFATRLPDFLISLLSFWSDLCFSFLGATMGTVGLSFGSPTSGQGFDVSSTVSAIVANLQNIETPWKNQLSTLESQDSAISSLGTLLSTLSNDLSNLTNAQGILAEKEGSSSDTGVLNLTAASSSAVAGTHTVEVTSLAQTSSGYLAPVSSASATLSGSITLQVGASGTPQTITLDSSDDTLSGLAAAINSSGVGVNASVLTDASGSRLSLVSGTSGTGGTLTISSNTIVAAKTPSSFTESCRHDQGECLRNADTDHECSRHALRFDLDSGG